MQYPGKINRQALVDFCKGKIPEIEKRNDQLLDALHYAEQQKNTHTINALEQGLMENYGAVRALREVCEWAREHMEEDPPIEDKEYDLDALKDQLKGRFR
jgi:hypothetical protein